MTKKRASSLLMGWLAVLTAVSFLVPNHYFPWVSFHEEWLTALGFAPMMAWAAWNYKNLPMLAKVALFVGLVPCVQWLTGLIAYRGDAIMVTAYLWGFALSIIAGVQWTTQSDVNVRDENNTSAGLLSLTPFWVPIILACIISFGICIHQWLDLQILAVLIADLPPNGRPFANLAQPNHLATLFLLGIGGIVFLFEAKKINGPVAFAVVLLFISGLVMTQSRTVMVAAAWALIAFFALKNRCHLRLPTHAVLTCIASFGLLTWLWPALNRWLLISDYTESSATRTSSDARWIYFQSAIDAISQKPWAGFGFQQINLAQRATEKNYHATYNYFQSAHNLFLDIALWAGLPVLLLVSVYFFYWLYCLFEKTNDALSWSVAFGIGFLLVHSMFEYPLYYIYFLFPFGFLLGALDNNRIKTFKSIISIKYRWLIFIPTFFCGLVFFQITLEYPQWEQDWRNARYEIQKFSKTEPAAHPSPSILDPIEDLLWFVRYPIDASMSFQDLERAKKVATRQSHTIVLFRYAQMAALNGRPEEATYYLSLLCQFHPEIACIQAKKDWLEAGKSRWPALSAIEFP